MPRKPRHVRARLPADLVSRAGRVPLAELSTSGLLRAIVEAVVNHVYTATGLTGMVAYVGLVVHDPDLADPQETPIARYPARSSQTCVAQATVCVHPVGCRQLCAAVDPGTGQWTDLEPGDVHVSAYGRKGADPATPHRLTWTDPRRAVPCVCVKILLA